MGIVLAQLKPSTPFKIENTRNAETNRPVEAEGWKTDSEFDRLGFARHGRSGDLRGLGIRGTKMICMD